MIAPPCVTTAPDEPVLTASAVATPVPSPETPVEIGRPVAFVRVPLDGVPRAGVTSVGLVASTTAPVPVTPPARYDATSAGKSSQMFLAPADQLTAAFAFELARIDVRASVVPLAVYVPRPTSHAVPSVAA